MATTPNFAATPKVGSVTLDNALGTSNSAAAVTGAASGTRVREIRVTSGATTAPGGSATKLIVLLDGGTARRVDVLSLTNAVDTFQGRLVYDNLLLPSASWSIKFVLNGTLTSGATLDCVVIGEDF